MEFYFRHIWSPDLETGLDERIDILRILLYYDRDPEYFDEEDE